MTSKALKSYFPLSSTLYMFFAALTPTSRFWILASFRQREAMQDGLAFQEQPTPEHLHHYQLSRHDLVVLQRAIHLDSCQKDMDIVSHQTNAGIIFARLRGKRPKYSPTSPCLACASSHQPMVNTVSSSSPSPPLNFYVVCSGYTSFAQTVWLPTPAGAAPLPQIALYFSLTGQYYGIYQFKKCI